MHLEDRLQICLLAVASRYPSAYIEINERIPGFKDIESACWKTLDLIDLLQRSSPDLLQAMAHLEIDAQRCVIYFEGHTQGVPTFIIYAYDKLPASLKVKRMQEVEQVEEVPQQRNTQLFQHILVPLDGSTLSEQTLPIALKIASASGGSIVLMQAVSSAVLNVRYATGATENARQCASHYLEMVKQSAIPAHVSASTAVFVGPPAEMIEAATRLHQSDLIVMSSHGESGFKRSPLGSVALNLSHFSTTPLLIIPDNRMVRRVNQVGGHSFRIMVALDGSSWAESVLLPVAYLSAALSAPAPGVVHLVRILHLPSTFEYGQDDSVSRTLRKETPEAEAYLQKVKERLLTGELARLQLQVTTHVDHDLNVPEKLLQVAQSVEDRSRTCDIIALATRARSGIRRWIMGSVAQSIVNAARFPVFIVSPQKSQGNERVTSASVVKTDSSVGSTLS